MTFNRTVGLLLAGLLGVLALAGAGCGTSATQSPTLSQAATTVNRASVPTVGSALEPGSTSNPGATNTLKLTSAAPPAEVVETPVASAPAVNTEGSWGTPNLEISVVPATLKIGATATVMVSATGQGGLPQYILNLDQDYLQANTPVTVNYSNFNENPSWIIEAVSAGTTSLSVSISYETRVCRDGNCSFNFTGAGSPSVELTVIAGEQPSAGHTGETEEEQDEVPDTAGSWGTPNLEILVVPTALKIGETATVTVNATGQGGLPQYRLNLDSDYLQTNTPVTVNYSNFSENPSWTIEAVNVGTTSLSVSVSYETKFCRDGNCFFNFTGAGTPSAEVTVERAGSATYTIETSVEPFYSGGEITLSPLPGPDGGYSAGTVVTLTASPSDRMDCNSSPYWSFTGWSGAVQSIEPRIEITMNSKKTVTANFTEFFPPEC